MDAKLMDLAYHRSRVDTCVHGVILFAVMIAALAFLVGEKFKPFQQGARFWSPTSLVWTPETRIWTPAEQLWSIREGRDRREKYVISPVQPETGGSAPTQLLAGEYVITQVDPSASGRHLVKEVHPISYSILFVAGTLFAWGCFYQGARRQSRMIEALVKGGGAVRAAHRPWGEVEKIFLAVLLVLLVELFLLLL
jgi:hypothetical protein